MEELPDYCAKCECPSGTYRDDSGSDLCLQAPMEGCSCTIGDDVHQVRDDFFLLF